MATVKTRPYVVTIKAKGAEGQRRLVRATFAHIAERHVIGHLVEAHVASKDDLIELLQQGIRLEEATDDPHQGELLA
jgi:hypothetical protein